MNKYPFFVVRTIQIKCILSIPPVGIPISLRPPSVPPPPEIHIPLLVPCPLVSLAVSDASDGDIPGVYQSIRANGGNGSGFEIPGSRSDAHTGFPTTVGIHRITIYRPFNARLFN